MRGPLNRYRCIDLDWVELNHLSNEKISRPSCFITGDLDPVNFMLLNGLKSSEQDKSDDELFKDHINKNYSDLRKVVMHYPTLPQNGELFLVLVLKLIYHVLLKLA